MGQYGIVRTRWYCEDKEDRLWSVLDNDKVEWKVNIYVGTSCYCGDKLLLWGQAATVLILWHFTVERSDVHKLID